MAPITRSDKEIDKIKEWAIQVCRGPLKDEDGVKSFLLGKITMLIWLTSDLNSASCYEEAKKLLEDGEKNAG